jgi:putative acetyltransferase
MNSIKIVQTSPDHPDAVSLIHEMQTTVQSLYPPSSTHGLSIDQLIQQKVVLFLLRVDDVAIGCGGVKFFRQEYAELKRIFIRPGYRGNGYAHALLQYLEDYIKNQGVMISRLATGILQIEAIHLYESTGYRAIPPFGEYQPDQNNLFFEKQLSSITDPKRIPNS